jgi:hypothetical protein
MPRAKKSRDLLARIIHYEITDAVAFGRFLGRASGRTNGTALGPEIALLRCMSSRDEKITVACPEGLMRQLLADEKASARGTFAIRREFPLRWRGWAEPTESTEVAA